MALLLRTAEKSVIFVLDLYSTSADSIRDVLIHNTTLHLETNTKKEMEFASGSLTS